MSKGTYSEFDLRLASAFQRMPAAERAAAADVASPLLPDGASENFRFVPIPIESTQTGNDASASAGPIETPLPTEPDPLSPRKRLAISALLCGGTLSSAAARVGVSARTLYAWRQEPAFAAELQRRSVEALEANSVRARNLLLKSTQVLSESLHTRERFSWALRLVNAKRLWEMAQPLPAMPEPTAADGLAGIDDPVTSTNWPAAISASGELGRL